MDCCEPTTEHTHAGHNSHEEDHGSHSAHGMEHGSAASYLRRFWIVTVLLVPLILTNEWVAGLIGIPGLKLGHLLQFGIATIIFGFSWVFFQHAGHEIKMRQYGMMTLVSMAVGAGYLFSAASTLLPFLEAEFYLEISTLIWVLLFGHYLEARSSSAAGDALKEVTKLLPRTAHLITEDGTKDVDVAELSEGNKVLVKAGEKVPADGSILEGEVSMDESLISGESKPVTKKVGEKAVAGSIVMDGVVTISLEKVGERSTIGQIQKLIAEAQKTKPRSQRLADKASGILTFIAGGTALATLLIWSLVVGETLIFSVTLAITVLVIACPHALGLAIPTVTTIATSLAVKNGVFIKDLSKLETIKSVDYVVLDKTGTLTEGKFQVIKTLALGDAKKEEVLRIAASLGPQSSHAIDIPIVEEARKAKLDLGKVERFESVGGKGIAGEIGHARYFLGNKAFMKDQGVLTKEVLGKFEELAEEGGTVVALANSSGVMGLISLADKVRPESKEAVEKLHASGIKVAMLTGDNDRVAQRVAQELGIDTYFAEVLPEDKYKHVKELQRKGFTVLMVGDGVNDAPALAQADIGVAIGAGTDVAVEAGDVVLMKNNPLDVVHLVKLARKAYRKMIQNLAWALGYNIIAIPAAAGVFAMWGFFLRPEIGALVMSLSTVIVVINALTLKKTNIKVA